MIACVEGEVIGQGELTIVVRVGGVGLQVYAPTPLRARLRLMDHIFLFTHLIVREDLLALYGFETEQEREYFELLLGVNGVGPRMAMSVLSVFLWMQSGGQWPVSRARCLPVFRAWESGRRKKSCCTCRTVSNPAGSRSGRVRPGRHR